MIVYLYDDKVSYFHTFLGFLAYFHVFIVMIYLTYEIAEFEIIHDHFIGDICEFSIGVLIALIITHISILFIP